MDDRRQTLETPGTADEPQSLPRVQAAVSPPQSKPGRFLPHRIQAARRGGQTPRRALPSKGDLSYARPPEV